MSLGWLGRLLKRLLDRFGGLNLLQLTLLWFTLGCIGLGLTPLIESLAMGFLPALVTVSLLTAWALAGTRLRNWTFGLTGALLGLLSLTLTTGKMGRALFSLLANLSQVTWQWVWERLFDFSPVATAWQALGEALVALLARFVNWFRALQSPAPLTDPLVIAFLCGMATWLAALWAAWWVRRRASALPGLLPAAAVLGYLVYWASSEHGLIWLVLAGGGILLLQAAISYRQALQRWARQRLDQVEIEPALAFSVSLLTIGMMVAGGLLPTISLEKINRAIDRLRRPEPATASAAGSQPVSGVPNPAVPHILGPGPSPSLEIVMYVSVEGYRPPSPVYEAHVGTIQQPVSYRWRAQTYDLYTGRGWFASTSGLEKLAAHQPFLQTAAPGPQPTNFEEVTQSVVRAPGGGRTVVAAGELLELDQPTTLRWRDAGDMISAEAASSIYTAISRLPTAGVEQMQAAGEEYPAFLTRYLQLPDELPTRVRDLALSLTVDQPTAFDKAAILEAYLRQFPYSLEVPGPPPGRDAVDFFLFDLKTGYCDYFASAMVVMARAVGLPARLAMGYSSGAYDYSQGYFVVRALNAHAWAEVYFPGIGWVAFEPTSNLPLPYRADQRAESSPPVSLPPPGQQVPLRYYIEQTGLGHLFWALLASLLVSLVILALPLESWWLSLLPADRVLKTVFRRLYRRGRRFGLLPDASRTPDEYARLLATSLEQTAGKKKRAALAAALGSDLRRLAGLYNRALFSDDRPGADEKRQAVCAWARLRRGLGKVRR